ESRLGPACAAIGIEGTGVGVDADDFDIQRRYVVDTGRHGRTSVRDLRSILGNIGTHIGDEVDLEGEEAAFLVHRHLPDRNVVAPLRIGEKMLVAVARPLHRPAETLRSLHDQGVFAVDEYLGAEAAADVRRHDAQLLPSDPEYACQDLLHRMDALRSRGEHETALV